MDRWMNRWMDGWIDRVMRIGGVMTIASKQQLMTISY
jgi:hypothetical protein